MTVMRSWWLLPILCQAYKLPLEEQTTAEVQAVMRHVAGSDECVAAQPVGPGNEDLIECCRGDVKGSAMNSRCWPSFETRSESITVCCNNLLNALALRCHTLLQEKSFATSATLALWTAETFQQLEKNRVMHFVQQAMLDHKEEVQSRSFAALDWQTLAKHRFNVEGDEALGELIRRRGSQQYSLLSAWGSALLKLPQNTISTEVRLICNVSTFVESLDPQQLQHFENFPDEPAYNFFSPSPLNSVEMERETEVLALQQYPELAHELWQKSEPKDGNMFAHILRSYGMHQASLPFRTGSMALCILYGLGRRGAWKSGHQELEVYEVGGGYGALVQKAGRVGLAHQRQHMGFRSWNIFDLEHVSALQAWYLHKTLTKSCRLERFCAQGLQKSIGGSTGHEAEIWRLPTSSKPVVRLITTKVKDLWLFSHRWTEEKNRQQSEEGKSPVRVMIALFSWSECEMDEFLWYFNHILPLCDYLLFGHVRTWPWEDSIIKYSLIKERMDILEEYPLTDADFITLFKRK